jgi:hypothetical protein
MTNLEIVIIGIAPMITLFVGIVGGLMFDRKKLAGLVDVWRGRYQEEKKTSKALEDSQAELEQAHEAKLNKIKKMQGKQFKLGVDAFLENCRSRAHKQLLKNEDKDDADQMYLSSLKMYQTSLDATLNTLNADDPVKFQELLAPLRAQVVETISNSTESKPGAPKFNNFQKTFRAQEVNRIKLRGLIEEVYRGGQVVVKEKKDELVLQLEQQLRERISQQQEMLVQLQTMEDEMDSAGSGAPQMRGIS